MAYIDNIALRGGIYGGWNYQITEDYVAGVEADFGWANETANLHGSLHRSCSTSESDWAVALASEQSLTALPVVIAHDKAALLVPQVQGHRSLLNQHIGGTTHTKKTSGVVIRSHQEKSMRIRGWADQISFGKAMQWPYNFP